MIEQIARFPACGTGPCSSATRATWSRTRSATGLPAIRDWVERNFRFSGYVSGFEPAALADRDAIRAELGYRPGEQVCVVTVGRLRRRHGPAAPGGRGVPGGQAARPRAADGRRDRAADRSGIAVPAVGRRPRGARLRARPVPAPGRVRPGRGPGRADHHDGAHRRQRPFIYVPLRHHFEQNFHVRHRLERYGAGRCLDYGQTEPEALAQAIAAEIGASGQLPPGRDRRRRPGRRAPGRAPLRPGHPRLQLRRASRASLQHVRQAVLTGEPRGPVQFRPGPLPLAQPDQGAAVRGERRGQRGRPRLPLRDGEQRRQHRAGPVRLAVPQPCLARATGTPRSPASRHRRPGCSPAPAARPPRRARRASRWRRPAEPRSAAGRPPAPACCAAARPRSNSADRRRPGRRPAAGCRPAWRRPSPATSRAHAARSAPRPAGPAPWPRPWRPRSRASQPRWAVYQAFWCG